MHRPDEQPKKYSRSQTVERIRVSIPGGVGEKIVSERRVIEGGVFLCRLFSTDGDVDEKIFECELSGRIEIEQRPDGEFILRATPIAERTLTTEI